MAYLERVFSKGRYYLYLKEYEIRKHYAGNSVIVYRFGRLDKALKNMYEWKENYNLFPEKLKRIGCDRDDLVQWIKTLETGIHKTGRKFAVQ